MKFDRVIKGGMIVDGTRQPRFIGDIGIRDGRIVEMGKIDDAGSAEVINASGMIVAPGFVDLHTHYDAQLFWDPYCSLSGWHGVTSAVIGNCGFGFAPMLPENRDRAMLSMTRIEAIPYESMRLGLPWSWVSYPEFLDAVDATPKAINILPYVPAGRAWVSQDGILANPTTSIPSRGSSPRRWMPAAAAGRPRRTARAAAARDYDGRPWSPTSHDDRA
jgi:N-acyl-D-aspartate/D-glutamate deacylase